MSTNNISNNIPAIDLTEEDKKRIEEENAVLYDDNEFNQLLENRNKFMQLSEVQQQAVRRWADVELLREHYKHFHDFLYDCMRDVLRFECSEIQLDIGKFISNEEYDQIMIQAQRGEGKSTITAIYAVWQLIHNCSYRVLIISAGSDVATEIASYVIQIIMNWEILECLRPDRQHGDRASMKAFDVHWQLKGVEKSPSVACIGITSNLQGRRSDILIADDIESSKNGSTEVQRAQLKHLTRDFSSITQRGRIIYLGTPQTVDSIYNSLEQEGFEVRIWTGRYPTEEQESFYVSAMDHKESKLAPIILERVRKNPSLRTGYGADGLQGAAVDPVIVPEDRMTKKERAQGAAYFQLQYMLNTTLSEKNRYPLKTKDLIVHPFSKEKAQGEINWMPAKENKVTYTGLSYIPELYSAYTYSDELYDFEKRTMFIDTAGGGEDETVAMVVYTLHGYYFVADMLATTDGDHEKTYKEIAELACKHDINEIHIEKNYGGGAFRAVMTPHLMTVYKEAEKTNVPLIEEPVASSGMFKEKRIAGQLRAAFANHRVIIHPDVLEYDQQSIQKYPVNIRESYSLIHQIGKLVEERGALLHDDRLDALAGAIGVDVDQLEIDKRKRMEQKQTDDNLAFWKEWGIDIGGDSGDLGNVKDRFRSYR